ncbi:MAG TPA: nuclear transport factor 2 family protein [Gemmatimonadales bacterium]|nr:nuclear transport factor 2 family protein [Gemmatimonadales bacterium]
MKWIVAAAVIVMIPACRNQAESPADRDAVIAASEQYRHAWLQGDTAMALGRASNDIRIMIAGVPDIVGIDGARALFVSEMSRYKIPTLTINRQDLIVRGDHAIDIGTYDETMVPKTGAPIHAAGRYMTIWRREGSEWRIIRYMLNAPK